MRHGEIPSALHQPWQLLHLHRSPGRRASSGERCPIIPWQRVLANGTHLRHLSQATREFLRRASVFGHLFAPEEVCQSGGYAEERVEVWLQEAIAAGFVSETPQDRCLFRHILVRDALYAELTTRQRRTWHRAAGLCIAVHPDHEERAGELIWHFTEGDVPEQALHYALIAARRSQRLNAHAEAQLHLNTALELAQRLQDLASEMFARERLGVTLDIVGEYDVALTLLEQAGAYYQQHGDTTAYWRTLASLGRVHDLSDALTTLIFLTSKLCAIADCYRYLEYALAVAHRLGDPAVLASVFFWSGYIAILTSDFKQAEHDLQAAFDMRRQLGLQAHISESSFMLGILYKMMGQRERALAYFTEALALAQAHEHYLDLIYTHIELAEYELLAGQGAAAWERFQALQEQLQRAGVPIEETAYFFAWAASAAGEPSIARELLAPCIVQLRASENAHTLLDALRVGAHVALHSGDDLENVRLDLDEALALTQAIPSPTFEVRVRYAYGLLATRLQEYPVAYQHFQEALVICERIGEGCYRPYVEQALAQLPHEQ